MEYSTNTSIFKEISCQYLDTSSILTLHTKMMYFAGDSTFISECSKQYSHQKQLLNTTDTVVVYLHIQ